MAAPSSRGPQQKKLKIAVYCVGGVGWQELSRHCGSVHQVRTSLLHEQPAQPSDGVATARTQTHLERVGRVLVQYSVALVLLFSVELALQFAHADFDAVSAGATTLLHIAVEKTRRGGEFPVEDMDSNGEAGVELRHFSIETAAFLGGDKTELNFASGRVVCGGVDKEVDKRK